MQFVERGCLFSASTGKGAGQLRVNRQTPKSVGWADNNNDDDDDDDEMIRLLSPDALQDKFPWLNADDVLLGSYGASVEVLVRSVVVPSNTETQKRIHGDQLGAPIE